MIDINKKYRTRDGREVRIYATDGGGYWPIHGAIQLSCSGWSPASWDDDGNAFNSFHRDNLIEVRPRHKRTVWVNVYEGDWDAYTASSKEDADENAADGRIACIKVELDFEEGEGL
jgi:hypothetical protein